MSRRHANERHERGCETAKKGKKERLSRTQGPRTVMSEETLAQFVLQLTILIIILHLRFAYSSFRLQ